MEEEGKTRTPLLPKRLPGEPEASAPPLELAPPDVVTVEALMPSGDAGVVEEMGGAGEAPFFTNDQVKKLQASAPPVEYLPVATPLDEEPPVATVLSTEPVVTTVEGVPIVAGAVSTARTERDGSGVKSGDPSLSTPEAIMLFLNAHNSRPHVCVKVVGYHYETHYSERTVKHKHGKETIREEHQRRVDDFEYRLDVTDFVFPYGFLYSDHKHKTTADLVQAYCTSRNALKALAVRKLVHGFDFDGLMSLIQDHCRSLGWRRDLETTLEFDNDSIRVYHANNISAMWENTCCFALMHVTVVPCLAMRLYRGDLTSCCFQSHRITNLKASFRIPYHPTQLMDFLRPLIWVPGWSGAQVAAGLLAAAAEYGIVAASQGDTRRRRRPGRRHRWH